MPRQRQVPHHRLEGIVVGVDDTLAELIDCATGDTVEHCRFVTSWGGVARCVQPSYRDGFCRFHYDCYRNGEITDRGLISESLDDQNRRREINFYGLPSGTDSLA